MDVCLKAAPVLWVQTLVQTQPPLPWRRKYLCSAATPIGGSLCSLQLPRMQPERLRYLSESQPAARGAAVVHQGAVQGRLLGAVAAVLQLCSRGAEFLPAPPEHRTRRFVRAVLHATPAAPEGFPELDDSRRCGVEIPQGAGNGSDAAGNQPTRLLVSTRDVTFGSDRSVAPMQAEQRCGTRGNLTWSEPGALLTSERHRHQGGRSQAEPRAQLAELLRKDEVCQCCWASGG